MSKRARFTVIAVVAVLVVAGGAYAAFAFLAGGDSPAPVSISSGDAGSTSGGSDAGASLTQAEFQGTWTVSQDGSFVGYRVREQLGFLPAPSDAVGRTSAVTGQLTVDGLSISAVKVTADLTQLQSDRSMRDERMRTIGLETDQSPTATFELTSPITLTKVPAAGEVVTATAKGKLTLHGVTKDVTMQIKGTLVNGRIEVVGSLPITFADYGIQTPNVGGFVSVQDNGTMEFKLFFAKS
jgi:polyisoprenoid-binding protein YceI